MVTKTPLVLQLSFWCTDGSPFNVDQRQFLSSRERKKCISSLRSHVVRGGHMQWLEQTEGCPAGPLHQPQTGHALLSLCTAQDYLEMSQDWRGLSSEFAKVSKRLDKCFRWPSKTPKWQDTGPGWALRTRRVPTLPPRVLPHWVH